jgi:beta-lactamase superfamily II metal-dependent hydrolase
MRTIFFKDKLQLEVNVIGYKEKGESIVFFLKTDDRAAYAGLVDCYEQNDENEAIRILLAEGKQYFDFICWTHPHDDHTIGLDVILEHYCNKDTVFWMAPIYSNNVDSYSKHVQNTYEHLFSIIQSRKRAKMKVSTAMDGTRMERCICQRLTGMGMYSFEICSFAPSSELLNANMVKENVEKGNLYSIGLIINIGEFYIMLAGDVENRTIKVISDYDLEFPIDYIKIPHHASPSADLLVYRLRYLDIQPPNVATSTVFRRHRLPDKEVLSKYASWNPKMELYCSDSIDDAKNDETVGIIKTTFDILQRNKFPIETSIYGSARKIDIITKVKCR